MSDATAAAPAAPAASDAPAAAAPAPASAPAAAPSPAAAPAAAPAAQTTLLTDDPKTTTDDATKPTDAEGDKPKDGKDDTAKKDEAPGAPEEYAAFELPESFKVDEPTLGEFKTLAKELNLSQEAAQKLVSMQARLQQGNAEAFTSAMQQHVDKTAQEWASTAKADPEFGGAKFDENAAIAKKALDTFGTPELKTLLNESRLGNHPEVIRLLFKAGKAISQDGFIPGRAASAPKDAASVLYGTPQSK